MRKILISAVLAALPALASATAYNPIAPFVPIYESYNSAITDYLYTLNEGEANYASGIGYGAFGIPFFVERYPQVTTTPLERYYAGAPQTEHVYNTATYPQDLINVTNLGYTHEGQTGNVYTQPVPGSIPLYRFVKFNPENFDHVHKFTTSENERLYLLSTGWTFDHIEGYVPLILPSGPFPGQLSGFPYLPGGLIMTRRCGTSGSCAMGNSFRDNYYGYLTVGATSKGNKTTQVMNFDLWTPDYFSPDQNEHTAIGLHGHWNIDFNNIDNVSDPARNHHGYGISLGNTGCGRGSVQVEAFTPTKINLPACDAQSGMQNFVSYHFTIAVSDSGQLNYTVRHAGTNIVVAQGQHDAAVDFISLKYGFPATDTGYFMVPSTGGSVDYSLYLSNFSVSWQ